MAEKTDNWVYDGISFVAGGMDSGTLPRLLDRGKAAFLFNATIRGGFPTDRPKYSKVELTFDSLDIQNAFETGLFQGAGYFRSQSGVGSVMASISGRLFQISPDTTGGGTVIERTIPGDPNLATQPQAWGWQSELWWILTDGNGLPIFVDDNTARRSAGPSLNVGTIAGAGFTVPAVNSNVTVTLASNYLGPLNAVVNIDSGTHSGNYIVISVGAVGGGVGYEASITNPLPGGTVPGTVFPIGTPVIVPTVSNLHGTTTQPFTVPISASGQQVNCTATAALGGAGQDRFVTIAGKSYKVLQGTQIVNGDGTYTFKMRTQEVTYTAFTVPSGTNIYNPYVAPQAGYTVGTLVLPFTVPAYNSSASAFLDTLYTGVSNLSVQIDNKTFRISPVAQAPPVPSTTIVLKNLTDNPGDAVPSGKFMFTIGELGIGRMGAYGHGRNWMSLIDAVSFTASDLVGESSGSSAYTFRDAVLKVSKNQALTGGKPFRVPSSGDTIQGMAFTAQLDASLGQGPLSVFTNTNVFSCLAPVDSSEWATLETPILPKTLIGSGTTSQWSISLSSGDLFFRSPDGIRSQLIARLDSNKWGNTPISHEMERVITLDDQNLLNFCSSVVFENRLLMTCNPIQVAAGVYHRGLMVINFDSLSSLQEKSPAGYDGLWTGLQILQLIQAPLNGFGGQTRQLALCFNSVDGKIELWEILPDGTNIADQISAEAICTDAPPEITESPATDGLTLWLDGATNWTDALWTDRIAAIPFVSNGIGLAAFTPPNLINIANLGGPVRTYTGTVNNASVIFFQYSVLSLLSACTLLTIGGAAVFKVEFVTAGGTIRVTTGGVDILNVSGLTNRPQEYIIQVSTDPIGGTILTVYNAATLSIVGTASMAAGVDLTGNQSVVLSNATPNIFAAFFTRGLLAYSAVPTGDDFTTTLNYLSSLAFGSFNIPIVCTVPQVRPIWAVESPDLFRGSRGELIEQYKALEGGEVSVDDVQGDVEIQVFYKPDQYPGWVLWHKWSISVDMSAENAQPGYFPRMGLGRPKSTDDNAVTGQLSRFGYTFQTRTVVQGHCRLLGSKYAASLQSEPKLNTPIDGNKYVAIAVPPLDDFQIYNINAGITTLPP